MIHFLLTRFNINFINGGINDKILNNEWLKTRLSIFENFCLPTLKNQTSNNFIWLPLFDVNTPEFVRQWVNNLVLPFEVLPVYLSHLHDVELKRVIKHRSQAYDYIITTRIDNDDSISCNFVELVQKCFALQSWCIINFQNGLCYNTVSGKMFRINNYEFNPFISLIEKNGKAIDTIFFEQHDRIKYTLHGRDVIRIDNGLQWCINLTNCNTANQEFGYLVNPKRFINSFNVIRKIYEPSFYEKIISKISYSRHKLYILRKQFFNL